MDEVTVEEDTLTPSHTSVAPSVPPSFSGQYQIYRRRWYIVVLFSCLSLQQNAVWNTFGPVDLSVRYAYGWSDAAVATLANWGPILFMICVIPASWGFERFGLRKATMLATALVATGTLLRTVTTADGWFLATSHTCAVLNGAAGVTAMAAPPAISVAWFPPHERTTATGAIQASGLLGLGTSYLIGPLLVPDWFLPNRTTALNKMSPFPPRSAFTFSTESHNTVVSKTFGNSSNTPSPADVRGYLQWYMIYDAVVATTILIGVVVYFPSRPPSPPSPSGAEQRIEFKRGLLSMVRNRDLWLVCLTYALPSGGSSGWSAVMTINFASLLGVNDEESGRIGLAAVVASAALTPLLALITDRWLRRRMRVTLALLNVVATLCYIWLALLCYGVIPFSLWQLYASSVAAQALSFASTPLAYEYAAEIAYPVPEGVVGAFLSTFCNVATFAFLGVLWEDKTSVTWMNGALVAMSAAPVPLVLLSRENYSRTALDDREEEMETLLDDQDVQVT